MGSNYSDKLKSPLWQKKRLEIFNRDKFKCRLCGDTETTLHVHHKSYSGADPWEISNKELITVCEHCHYELEKIKFDGHKFEIKKILKMNNWENNSRIMYFSAGPLLYIRIYDANNKFICGFSFFTDKKEMVNILNNAIRYGQTS